MAIFIGDANNKAQKVKKLFIGNAAGKAQKIKKVFIGDANSKAQLVYTAFDPPAFTGTYVMTLNDTSDPSKGGYIVCKTSGTLTLCEGIYDLFLVGGGASGGGKPNAGGTGPGGGASGYMQTRKQIAVTPGSYPVAIGSGAAESSKQTPQAGGQTSVTIGGEIVSADGGSGITNGSFAGGAPNNDTTGNRNGYPGTGSNKRAFDDASMPLYGGGGGGAAYYSNGYRGVGGAGGSPGGGRGAGNDGSRAAGVANTGGGGGGACWANGAAGGSGLVIVRWAAQ